MKFKYFFSEPQIMSDGDYAIDGTLSRELAASEIGNYISEDIKPEQLKEDRVRFGFPGEGIKGACWWSGATGRGSQPIWVFEG